MSLYQLKTEKKHAGKRSVTLEEMDAIRDQLIVTLRNEKPHLLSNIKESGNEITTIAYELLEKKYLHHSREELKDILKDLTEDIYGWGPISDLMKDVFVTDIWIIRYDYIRYEKLGKKYDWPQVFKSESHLIRIAERMASSVGRKVDEATPLVDCRLPDGSRVSIVMKSVSLGGTTVTIRRFGMFFNLEDLAGNGMFQEEMIPAFEDFIRQKKNIFIVGGFGTGKNTIMNAMLARVSHEESLILVEETAESPLLNAVLNGPKELREKLPKDVRLFETRYSSIEGTGEVTLDTIFRHVLKMNPTRVTISEVRDSVTVYYGLLCMNLGQPGSMFTGHGSSAKMGLKKADMLLASYRGGAYADPRVRADYISAIDLIFYLEQNDERRYIEEICRVEQHGPGLFPVAVPVYRFDGQKLIAV